MTKEIYAVVWTDLMLGYLSLIKPDGNSAVKAALSLKANGVGKVDHVRAIHLSATNVITDLI